MTDFDIEKTISYWLESSKYDIGVADAMYQTGKYPYALFMGHLALEKLLKSIFVKHKKEHAPITHSLPFLASKTELKIPRNIVLKLREFMEFHLESRYPDYNMSFYKKCTKDYAKNKLQEIKEVYEWLTNQL